MERFHKGGQNYGFLIWKQQCIRLSHREYYTNLVSKHLLKNIYRSTLERWRQAIAKEDQLKLTDAIVGSQKEINSTEN